MLALPTLPCSPAIVFVQEPWRGDVQNEVDYTASYLYITLITEPQF